MLVNMLIAITSFGLGFLTKRIIELVKNKKKARKTKPLSKQNFKQAMKDLEIK